MRRGFFSRARSRVPSTSPTVSAGTHVLASGVAAPEEGAPQPAGDRADRSLMREALLCFAALFALALALGLSIRGPIALFP